LVTYSYSRLSTYHRCPLQYRFRYVERRKLAVGPTVEAFLGSRVHEALEWLHRQAAAGGVPTSDELIARYDELWNGAWRDDVRIVRARHSAESFLDLGRELLRRYHARHRPFAGGTLLGTERRFHFALDNTHAMSGLIDRLTLAHGNIVEVHDYKTGATLPTPEEAASDRQAGVYDLAARHLFPEAADVRLVWHYLRFDEQRVSSRTPLEREALREELIASVKEIEASTSFPANESALCQWCDFLTVCPAKANAPAVASPPGEDPASESGVALVDRLVTLRERLRDARQTLEEEIAAAEEALIAYAARQGLEAVSGTAHEALIDRQPKLSFPEKGDPRRLELEKAVRGAGLWERSTDLSPTQLRRLLVDGAVDEDTAAALRGYATVLPHATVRLVRRRNTPSSR